MIIRKRSTKQKRKQYNECMVRSCRHPSTVNKIMKVFSLFHSKKQKVTERGWKIEYNIEFTLYIILLKLVECEVLYMYIVFIKII